MRKLWILVLAGLAEQFDFFKKLFTKKGRTELEIDEINDRLATAVIDQERKKRILKKKILKHFGRQFSFSSKYIRAKGKNKHHIHRECYKFFGEEMHDVNLTLTTNLELK